MFSFCQLVLMILLACIGYINANWYFNERRRRWGWWKVFDWRPSKVCFI